MGVIDKFKRWRTGRGFGVQSPSAYSFIRYVIKERYPYYCYADLIKFYQNVDNDRRLQLELFFRLANYWQPLSLFTCKQDYIFNRYINTGCGKTEIVHSLKDIQTRDENHIIVLDCMDDNIQTVVQSANKYTMVIVVGINESERWNAILASKEVIRSYDLVDIGILFFDDRKLKEHYRLSY